MKASVRATLFALIVSNDMRLKLLPFQQQGVDWLRGRNGLLGDQAGVGKTPQAIFLADEITASKAEAKILVITLASLKYQFQNELDKFLSKAESQVIDGSKAEREIQWRKALLGNTKFVIMNYELLLRDLPFIQSRVWDLVIADECTRLSNHTNKQWKALRLVKSLQRIAMTGTAVSNSPLDVYGILEWLNPGCLGNYFAFMETYTVRQLLPNGHKFVVAFKNLDKLQKLIAPYYIRRTKEQVLLELPDKVQTEVPFELGDKERSLYDDIKARLLLDLENADVSKITHLSQLENGLVNLTRLRQLACSPELIGENKKSSKLEVLKDLLTTLQDRKVIIFSEFAEMCKIIHREVPSLMIIGEVGTAERAKIVEQFNTDPELKVLVMSAAGAFGLNLQAADVVIHYDLPWSVAKYEQRAARSHRRGQKNTVFEYSLIANNTVDEYVLKKLTLKQDISEGLMPVSEIIKL